ncbi:unnamed protein product [Caenorhabditis bovis]|uniref:Uncharacterized protein n=1 Tax=Caenorhabditis bovis TaxID=2654633 RepID=A0A8S1ET53_9PELO|nr:unnamed protein product [Caenorhabditis bovis]
MNNSKNSPPEKENFNFNFTPEFKRVSRFFHGQYPFKDAVVLDMRGMKMVNTGILRQISQILKNVLSLILDSPDAHQTMAVRMSSGRFSKKKFIDIPENVLNQICDYLCQCYGYPPKLRFPGYSYEDLLLDDPLLAGKLGNTEEERKRNFVKLIEDVTEFCQMTKDKLQRILNDLRSYKLIHTETGKDVHGNSVYRAEFVKEDNTTGKKNNEAIKTIGPIAKTPSSDDDITFSGEEDNLH